MCCAQFDGRCPFRSPSFTRRIGRLDCRAKGCAFRTFLDSYYRWIREVCAKTERFPLSRGGVPFSVRVPVEVDGRNASIRVAVVRLLAALPHPRTTAGGQGISTRSATTPLVVGFGEIASYDFYRRDMCDHVHLAAPHRDGWS